MSPNPFIEKAERQQRQRATMQGHYDALVALLRRCTDADTPEMRERIRRRVEEARTALEEFSRA